MQRHYFVYYVVLDKNFKQLCEGNTQVSVSAEWFSIDACQTALLENYERKTQTTDAKYAVIRNMTLL